MAPLFKLSKHLLLGELATVLLFCCQAMLVNSDTPPWAITRWGEAHATFYGGEDASGTMGGACGYGNLYSSGYGTTTTALSYALFNDGLTCGSCFEIVCDLSGSQWCYPDQKIKVTATNSCPPGSLGGWCDPPRLHFDLSYPMFTQLAQAVGGVIPIYYKRVSCSPKHGGVRFTITGNPWWVLVLVSNVGGNGDVVRLSLRENSDAWISTTKNWGQNWALSGYTELIGQTLSFKVTLANRRVKKFYNVAPSNWGFDQTYEGNSNFR